MGFLKDVSKLNKMGKELRDSMPPPGERLAQATAQMRQQAEASTTLLTGIDGVASIVSVAQTGTMINFNPAVQLELLVTMPSSPPYPVVVQQAVPQIHLPRAQPGCVVAVKVDPADRSKVAVDWDRQLG